MKLDDIQLSLVLSAHENGGLVKRGMRDQLGYPGCLRQIANQMTLLCGDCGDTTGFWWFDTEYDKNWTTEQFIGQLENQGLA